MYWAFAGSASSRENSGDGCHFGLNLAQLSPPSSPLQLLLWALRSFVYVSIKKSCNFCKMETKFHSPRPLFVLRRLNCFFGPFLCTASYFQFWSLRYFVGNFLIIDAISATKKVERSTSCTSAKTAFFWPVFGNCPWFPNMYNVYHLRHTCMQWYV